MNKLKTIMLSAVILLGMGLVAVPQAMREVLYSIHLSCRMDWSLENLCLRK